MTDLPQWLRDQCIYTKMARRSMKMHLERDNCVHCTAANEIERLTAECRELADIVEVHIGGIKVLTAANAELTKDLLASGGLLQAENTRLRDARKHDCVEFFRWWWNQSGSNTEQGYDEWEALAAIEGKEDG